MKIGIIGTSHESSEKFAQMKAIFDACTAADIEPPSEVCDFFDNEDPPSEPPDEIDLEGEDFVKIFKSGDNCGGFVIDLRELADTYDESQVRFLKFTAKE